ncbi:hypothetical protein [Comamonas testosteroni]|uniref:hypothetical protein n=1 Tax=Comamonas testosteroni TaxID=285 RepID=UPI0028F044F2|nr:hypothetical protein [Comamonas testosteroni]
MKNTHSLQVQSHYSFLPVGQGTFSIGSLEVQGRHNSIFRWVYDCGAVKGRQNQLVGEIDRQAWVTHVSPLSARPTIDLVFISHFDNDHVSGLVELLSRFDVTTLVLPFIPLWKRLALAVSVQCANYPRLQEFLFDPIGFIGRIEAVKIQRIYLVPPSDKNMSGSDDEADPPLDSPIDDALDLRPSRVVDFPEGVGRVDVTLERLEELPFKVSELVSGGRLLLGNFWEFVPYNDPTLKTYATPIFRAAVSRVSSALLKSSIHKRQRILSRLKSIYDRTFGATAKQRNLISLFLYSGPVGIYAASDCRYSVFKPAIKINKINWLCRCYCGQCYFCGIQISHNEKVGILYTGDGYLDTASSFNYLSNYLGRRRFDQLRVLQVMHHGSRKNWHKGLAVKFSPVVSIFCADPKYTYRHPHAQVLSDFASYGPVIVDGNSGYTCFQCIDW